MRIAAFLEESRDLILQHAISFARAIPALHGMNDTSLRNHLPLILETISADLRKPQTREESIAKSHGQGAKLDGTSSAQTHGVLRAQLGLSIGQLVAEYRALRASVLRLLADAHTPDIESAEDINRFHEAIDQAIAESVDSHAAERERWRQIFLGILGHDLRDPLNAIALTVQMMRARESATAEQTAILQRGVTRLTSLLDALLEYSRAELGASMQLHCAGVDLASVCAEEIGMLRAANPRTSIDFETRGTTAGWFDATRVGEALSNLVSNAIKHGDPAEPAVVRLNGSDTLVRVAVENAGHIDPQDFQTLFEPLSGRHSLAQKADQTHLGLGLFITRQIARAHGGEVTGACADGRCAS